MANVPPPYSSVFIGVGIEVPQYPLDDEKVTKMLHDKNTQKSISDEIAKLSKLTLTVEESFHKVEELLLLLVSNREYPSSFKDGFVDLSRQWSAYRKEYTQLLWESRAVAGRARSDAAIFHDTVIPWLQEDNVNLAEKIAGLGKYIKSLEGNVESSKDLSQRYSNLKRNVEKFSRDWNATIESCKTQIAAISKNVKALDEQIHELGQKIQGIKEKIAFLMGGCAVAVGGAGAAAILGVICPLTCMIIWAGAAAVAAGGAIYYRHVKQQHDELIETRDEKLRERKSLRKDLNTMQQLRSSLVSTAPEIQNVIDTIGTFAQVWNMICMDAQGIKDRLEKTQQLTFMAKRNLQTTADMYQTLCSALYQFQTTIS